MRCPRGGRAAGSGEHSEGTERQRSVPMDWRHHAQGLGGGDPLIGAVQHSQHRRCRRRYGEGMRGRVFGLNRDLDRLASLEQAGDRPGFTQRDIPGGMERAELEHDEYRRRKRAWHHMPGG